MSGIALTLGLMSGHFVEKEPSPTFSFFRGKKVLVTGASGFIGSHLCHRLIRNGAQVHAISRSKRTRDEENWYWQQADLTEAAKVRDFFHAIRPEIVFHLAGYPVGSRTLDHVLPSFRHNLISTVNLLTVAAEIGCGRIILTGSLEEPEVDISQCGPSSPYAAAKWAGSMYAHMFHTLYQLPVVIARVFMVYGPGQQDMNKLVPYTIFSLLRGEAPKLSSGRREIDWIYVDDVINGFLVTAQTGGLENQTLDIGTGKLVAIRSVVEEIVRLINPGIKPLFGALNDRPFEQVRAAVTQRTRAIMGWEPVISLETGLQLTVDWYKSQINYSPKKF